MASSKTQRLKSPSVGATEAGNLGRQSAGTDGYRPEDQPPAAARDYAALSFKELLAACPLEGIELTRERGLPRDVNL